MTHVVSDNCTGCRFTECVTVCPVECFHGDAQRLYIDPVLCIDCGACVPICPVKAIKDSVDLTPDEMPLLAFNAEHAKQLPVVGKKEAALPGAEARRAQLGFTP